MERHWRVNHCHPLQTTDLIARQHFSPQSISSSETVVELANNCIAAYDRAGPSQGASLTNGRFNSKANVNQFLSEAVHGTIVHMILAMSTTPCSARWSMQLEDGWKSQG
jgi:hypothetical protein